jgi:type IV secretion system protein VirD4
VKAAFPQKPTLLYDNCSTQIYLCPPSGYETAERISKQCGDQTITVESANEGMSHGGQQQGQHGGKTVTYSSGRNWAVQGRALLRPEEVMALPSNVLIAFVRNVRPLICRRVAYYNDPLFAAATGQNPRGPGLGWLLLAAAVGLLAWQVWEAMR